MSRDDYHDYSRSGAERRDYAQRRSGEVTSRGRQRTDLGFTADGGYGYSERRRSESDRDSWGARPAGRSSRGGSGGGGYRAGGSSRRPPAQKRRRALVSIAVLGAIAFTVGFIAMWSLGSVIVGGSAFGGSRAGELSAASMPIMEDDSSLEPLVDHLAFRDASYMPVKGTYVRLPTRTPLYFDRVLAAIDRTELNALVLDMKDDRGRIAFDTDISLGSKYGTIVPAANISDLDSVLGRLAEHQVVPIARIVCFKDPALARKRPEMAIQTPEGGVYTDGVGDAWLNPYNHDVWEYLVQIAEECALRGFREIQFDYVRFPDSNLANAVYPGQYCSKEDAIAGFLAYARPRLETLGVWVSADCFGVPLGTQGDANIGQQIEKICQNIDILCPMPYPSHYTAWSLGIDNPSKRPYDIMYQAMTLASRRLTGTGAKGRPYLLDADDRAFVATAESVKAQIQAVEDLGFNEWILWGGYIEEALRTADGTYNGPALTTYAPRGVGGGAVAGGPEEVKVVP